MFAQPGRLFRRLYPFGDGRHIQSSCQRQNGIQHRRRHGLGTDRINKTTVDFEVVHGEMLKVNQRAVAGTKIINGDFKPFVMQPFEKGVGFPMVEHIALGNFQHDLEVIRRQQGFEGAHIVLEAFRMQMPRCNVNTHLCARR